MSSLKSMAVDMPPLVAVNAPTSILPLSVCQQPLQDGIRSYVDDAVAGRPSLLLSLQDRKIPTAEEIAQKKMTFNMIFWGGGFVAPFIATVFYFGFRFWEK